MLRQRIRLHVSPLAVLGQLFIFVIGAALVWYWLMLLLLALDLDHDSVNAISGYRDAYDYLSGLRPNDVDTWFRVIAGLVVSPSFGRADARLGTGAAPLPHPQRSAAGRGQPRRPPRPATRDRARRRGRRREHQPSATRAHAPNTEARSRSMSDLRRPATSPSPLADIQGRARSALEQHGLPAVPVAVTLTGFDRTTRRELA